MNPIIRPFSLLDTTLYVKVGNGYIFNTMRLTAVILMILCTACTPLPQSSSISNTNPKALNIIDKAYENKIRTIQLSPPGSTILPAVARLNQNNLILQFDDLSTDLDTYYARIIHCTYDWKESDL